ncbi:dispersed gene family protein 1 (DGF-1), partial [Trypanosoma rangeli]
PSVNVVPCDSCALALACFGALTASFSDCACNCSAGGLGAACLPFDVPLAKGGGGGGGGGSSAQGCVRGVTLTESMAVGGGQATACFDSVVFSGPITVTVELGPMDPFAGLLNVTLRHCVLAGGAQLRIVGLDEDMVHLMPRAVVNMTNVTLTEGTIVLQGTLPPKSRVLLADSSLHATVGGSQYVPTTAGYEESRYGPVLVLDGVRLLSSQLVLTRTTLACEGSSCAAILVEHGLMLDKASSFYMDNCAAASELYVMYSLESDLSISGGSVFSVQNSSWEAPSSSYQEAACVFKDVVVGGGSVLQFVSSRFRLGFAMLIANRQTVSGDSWLVHRDNDFRVAYVNYVSQDSGLSVRDRSVWSILRNSFGYGSYLQSAYMTNSAAMRWNDNQTIYGMCNEKRGSVVKSYRDDLGVHFVTALDCGVCAKDAVCFTARTSGFSDCRCECTAGGYGDTCLPAAVPGGLGPLPLPDAKNKEVHCVHGGRMGAVGDPTPGVRGLCFVNVTFTAAIVLDLSSFNAPQQTLNITLLQCVFIGLSIKGGGERVHVNVTSSLFASGHLEFEGFFGASSQILLAGSAILATPYHAVYFPTLSLGVNSTLLLLGNRIKASNYAVYFPRELVIDGGGVVMKGNTLRVTDKSAKESSAVYVHALGVKNGGYFDVENNTMSAVQGLYIRLELAVSSTGLLRVADCTFVGSAYASYTSLLYVSSTRFNLESGGQLRLEDNNVSTASVFSVANAWSPLRLSGSGTTVVFARNRQADASKSFVGGDLSFTVMVTSPAQFLVGCNLQGDGEASYGDGFPKEVVRFSCGTCKDEAACYMPGTESVDGGSCSCSCKDGRHGASCLPFEVPDIVVPLLPERAVDDNTSCVVGQTLTELTLDMWKTHHCYVGVTFIGKGAVVKFFFPHMPLHLPINITFSGCTFLDGAALLFVGGGEAAESAGVLIRVSQTVMRSSVVAFSGALPQRCDIAVTEVDAVQLSSVNLAEKGFNDFSVVLLREVLLTASSLLVSNVKARSSGDNSAGVMVHGYLSLVNGSSLYVRYCSFEKYKYMVRTHSLNVSDHSVFALLNNTMTSGSGFLYGDYFSDVSDHSVLRMVGNSGPVSHGICARRPWTVRQSSWLDWRGNDVRGGIMFSPFNSVELDSSSAVTLMGCKMGSTGLGQALLKGVEAGYKFVAGCLTVAGKVLTAAEMERNGINNVTNVAACGECTRDGDCFDALTTAFSDCKCECAGGGHGDVCAPVAAPVGPPPPSLPSPPAFGECLSDMEYPEVAQAVGGGLSWLCYRNVTFSGALCD